MNKWQIICPLTALAIVALVMGVMHERNEHRGFRAVATSSIAWDLVRFTNSVNLVAVEPELSTILSNFLGSKAGVARLLLGDEQEQSGGVKAWTSFVLTNELGQGLAIGLTPEKDSKHFRVLSYRRINEFDGAPNGSQPIRAEMISTSSAAGSHR